MKLVLKCLLILASVAFLIPGTALFQAGVSDKEGVALMVGAVSLLYAIGNTVVLTCSFWKRKGVRLKTLRIISLAFNSALLLAWLASSLDYGGLQGLEASAIIFLAVISFLNWYALKPGKQLDSDH